MKRSQAEQEPATTTGVLHVASGSLEHLTMGELVERHSYEEGEDMALTTRLDELDKNRDATKKELNRRGKAYIMENLRAFSLTNDRCIDSIGPIVDYSGPVAVTRDNSMLTCDGHAWTVIHLDGDVSITWFKTPVSTCAEASQRYFRAKNSDDDQTTFSFDAKSRNWSPCIMSLNTSTQFVDTLHAIKENNAIARVLFTELQFMYQNFENDPLQTYYTIEQLKANRERNQKKAKMDEEEKK